jgi:hypothetical protein
MICVQDLDFWIYVDWSILIHLREYYTLLDLLCGLLVRVLVFDSRGYQIIWEVVCLERGPVSLVSITEELLEWKSSGSGSRKSRLTAVGIR